MTENIKQDLDPSDPLRRKKNLIRINIKMDRIRNTKQKLIIHL
jgi:hypothetical protein